MDLIAIHLSEKEFKLLELLANEKGISIEEAAEMACSHELSKRARKVHREQNVVGISK